MSWFNLGTLTPATLGQWMSFNGTVFENITGNPTYKISCTNVNPGNRFKSFCWFRFQFFDPTNEEFLPTPQFRVYPSTEPLVKEIELPQMLLDIGSIIWIPEIQKRVYPNFLGRSDESLWGVKLEEWRPDTPPPPDTLDGGEY